MAPNSYTIQFNQRCIAVKFNLPVDLYRSLELFAKQRGVTMSAVVCLAVTDFIGFVFHPYTLIRGMPVIEPKPRITSIDDHSRPSLGVNIVASVHVAILAFCRKRGVTVSELMRQSIKNHLSKI